MSMFSKNCLSFALKLFITISTILNVDACLISGQQIGICQQKAVLSSDSFCFSYIADYVCLPSDRPTWSLNDESYRDKLIEEIFMKNLEAKLVAQYQDPWSLNIISNNLLCYYAYRNFLCRWNIPQCNPDTLKTITTCRSYCIQFFSNCQGNTQICDVLYSNQDLGLDVNC